MKTSNALKRLDQARVAITAAMPANDTKPRARARAVGVVEFARFGAEERVVPRRQARRAQAKAAFLKALETGLRVNAACRISKISSSTAYKWRRADPAFARAWDQAELADEGLLEDILLQAGIGTPERPGDWRAVLPLMRRRQASERLIRPACCPNCGHLMGDPVERGDEPSA